MKRLLARVVGKCRPMYGPARHAGHAVRSAHLSSRLDGSRRFVCLDSPVRAVRTGLTAINARGFPSGVDTRACRVAGKSGRSSARCGGWRRFSAKSSGLEMGVDQSCPWAAVGTRPPHQPAVRWPGDVRAARGPIISSAFACIAPNEAPVGSRTFSDSVDRTVRTGGGIGRAARNGGGRSHGSRRDSRSRRPWCSSRRRNRERS